MDNQNIEFNHERGDLAPAMGLDKDISMNIMLEVNRSVKIRAGKHFTPSEILEEVLSFIPYRDNKSLIYASYLVGAWSGEQLILDKLKRT